MDPEHWVRVLEYIFFRKLGIGYLGAFVAGLRIWIRIRVKRWIRICIKVRILELLEAQNGRLEARVDALNGGVEAQNGALEGL
jgi:hypothetical protein